MATAIMILSNDGGQDRALIISASKDDARAVAGIAKRCTGSRYLGIDNPQALQATADAWGVIGRAWEEAHKPAESVQMQKAI